MQPVACMKDVPRVEPAHGCNGTFSFRTSRGPLVCSEVLPSSRPNRMNPAMHIYLAIFAAASIFFSCMLTPPQERSSLVYPNRYQYCIVSIFNADQKILLPQESSSYIHMHGATTSKVRLAASSHDLSIETVRPGINCFVRLGRKDLNSEAMPYSRFSKPARTPRGVFRRN